MPLLKGTFTFSMYVAFFLHYYFSCLRNQQFIASAKKITCLLGCEQDKLKTKKQIWMQFPENVRHNSRKM